MAVKKGSKPHLIFKSLVWERLRRNPRYKQAVQDFPVMAQSCQNVSEVLDLMYDFSVRWRIERPIPPDTDVDEAEAVGLFFSYAPELLGYGAARELVKDCLGKTFLYRGGCLEMPAGWEGKDSRFSVETWATRYQLHDLIKKGYRIEDAALKADVPSLKTAYRLYNDAGRHIMGEDFQGIRPERRQRTLDRKPLTERDCYLEVERRALRERLGPRAEEERLQDEWDEGSTSILYPTKQGEA